MTLTVLTGAAGAGKTNEILTIVHAKRDRKERVFFVSCLDGGPVRPGMEKYGVISSRTGRKANVDFKGHIPEIRDYLRDNGAEPASFVFDEAHRLGDSFAQDWIALSRAGHEVIVSTPSAPQLEQLKAANADVRRIRRFCDMLADAEATTVIRLPGSDATISVCDSCAALLRKEAIAHLHDRLIATQPSPGTTEIYQPIDGNLPEFADLVPIRADSALRAEIMADFIAKHIGKIGHWEKTYLDVGCNSGFFCKRMADLGFHAMGIDVAPNDIHMGRVADSYIYNRHLDLQVLDALTWVPESMPVCDVTSTFSVYQWLFDKHDHDKVLASMRALMDKTRKLFFFEMGYTDEAHYRDRLKLRIDRDWCLKLMRDHGGFSEIVTYDAGWRGLKRDFFVGVKP